MVDVHFATEVGRALGVTTAEIGRLIEASKDVTEVEALGERVSTDSPRPGDQEVLDAWIISTMMRGLYHDEVARLRGRQHYRHPIRAFAGHLSTSEKPGLFFEPDVAQRYFSALMLGITFRASKDPLTRIRLFTVNIVKARTAFKTGLLSLPGSSDDPTDAAGLEHAVDGIRTLIRDGHLDTGEKHLKPAVEIAIALGGAGLGFVLSPWAGAIVGLGMATAQTLAAPGDRLARLRGRSRRNLRQLARAVGGPVDLA